MKSFNWIVGLLLVSHLGPGQDQVTISGYVKDSTNGEELIGVNVFVLELKTGTVTNGYGFYSITLPPAPYNIQFSYIGFETKVEAFNLAANLSHNIHLAPITIQMEEVVVKGDPIDLNVTGIQTGKNKLNMTQVRKLPTVFGEVDILKNIQLQPGVISAGEGTSSFFVRGGSSDQNLILIDEAPIYDPSHLFGLFSVFNGDVVKDAELYRGGIAARFGGRLSSILEVRTKDGNNKKVTGVGGIGTMAARFSLEGPMRREKSSFIVSGRRSYFDAFLKAANQKNLVSFFDVNAKVNWRQNNNNRFFVAFYAGRDAFTLDRNFSFGWGNATATVRWNHLFNDRLFSNTTLVASHFDYKLTLDDPVQGFEWTSSISQYSVLNDMAYFISPKNELTFGYHLNYRGFQPGIVSPTTGGSVFITVKIPRMFALDQALYLDNNQQLSEKISLSYGSRLSIFQQVGPYDLILYQDPTDNINIVRTGTRKYSSLEPIRTYVNMEPRLSARYLVSPMASVKLSYNRMVQNTHLISSGTVPLPFNTWNPSGYYLKPQKADQYTIGYFQNLKNHAYEFSIESYYKNMMDVTDFADNAQIFFNTDIVTEFRQGKSWAYGVELQGQKKEGNLTGFFSYTWSKVYRKVEGVNQGNSFFSNHDRRNVVNLAATYEMSRRWSFGSTFSYGTGRPITLPAGRYEFNESYLPDVVTGRNGYRLPAFHRLDVSATLTPQKKKKKKWKSQYVFSILNVYNRKNPFTIYTRVKQDKDGNIIGDGTEKEARLIYLFPFLPSFTYNFTF